jgi:hypothetical protein
MEGEMGILTAAQLDNSKFKAAVRGASGSGKTWWATAVAIGLHKAIGSKKPIAFWDTENALSYVLPHFQHNGIQVVELKARAFKLANNFFDEAEATCDIAIIDSVTHVWEELIQSFKERKHKEKLAVWDWGIIKPEYREGILNRIVNTPLHLIVCGRITDIYEYVQIDGDKVLTTTGSKMSAEKNTEYEPSLTVELEKFTMTEDELKAAAMAQKGGAPNLKLIKKASRFRMTVIKDRANVLGGVYEFEPHPGEFVEADNEIWNAVKPFCDALNIGGAHVGVNLGVKSTGIFESPDTSYQERERQKTILLEEVEAELKTNFGQSKEDKSGLIALLKEAFGTPSWTAIQSMDIERIRRGHARIVPPPEPVIPHTEIRDMPGLIDKLKADLECEDVEPEIAVPWDQIKKIPLANLTEQNVLDVVNMLNYPLTGADPKGIRKMLPKYLKAAIEKLEAWDKEGAK